MAARRITRTGLLRAEHPPVQPPPCPSCRRPLSSALHLHPSRTDNTAPSLSRQAATGWAALSKAGHALFTPANTTGDGQRAGQVELSGTAAELVNQLKMPRSDPHRVWSLFSQLDLEGNAHTLPLVSLHALLPAIHLKPASSSSRPLSLHASTAGARAYALKVDLIRTRLRQAGGATTPGDWNALLAQYHALRFAPGAGKVWDEMIAAGFTPSAHLAIRVLETFLGWVEMHGRTSGRAVERTAAEPLVRKAVAVLAELHRAGKRVEGAVELLLKLAIKAKDLNVFATAVKEFYAFDLQLPGAAVELGAGKRAMCEVGEAEVVLMLEALAEKDDLPGMIAIFETFDHAAPSPSADPAFFTQSFSSLSLSDPSTSSTPTPAPSPSSDKPHPIGTRAFTTLIQTAARLGNGGVTRHYFDLLFMRWQHGAAERLGEIELAVGIVPEAAETEAAEAVRVAREGAIEAVEEGRAVQQVEAAEEAPVDSPPRSHSIASASSRHLAAAPSQPSSPYVVPSTIIGLVAHHAHLSYDAPTARWLRMRTRRIIQLMESYTSRIAAVLDKVEPTPSSSAPASTDSPAPTPVPASIAALQRELTLSTFHLDQLRLTLNSVKLDSNIVTAYDNLHKQQIALNQRSKRVAQSSSLGKKDIVKARPALRRKEKQVLLARQVVVRHRLRKLREVEGQGPGRADWDKYMAELRVIQAKLVGEGWTETGEQGEVLGQLPHVAGLRSGGL